MNDRSGAPSSNPTGRFGDRTGDYDRYRPGYPEQLLDRLQEHTGLAAGATVTDIGSGTGIFTAMLLSLDIRVHAVEPNRQMRLAAERRFSGKRLFNSIDATAERTRLKPKSVDLVTAAQAFHWFNPKSALAEFRRILRPGASVALIWNVRDTVSTPFLRNYEALLQHFGTDYRQVDHTRMDRKALEKYFDPLEKYRFDNEQVLDFEGLKGRLLSTSYVPGRNAPQTEWMLTELGRIFERHANHGTVRIFYDTELYIGAPR